MKKVNNLTELEALVGFNTLNKCFTEYAMLTLGCLKNKSIVSVADLTTDSYGNNTNFPDSVLSDMTIKGLLGKWTSMIFNSITGSLGKYYIRTRNIDANDMNFVRSMFYDSYTMISKLTPVLEDMVNENIYGIEDIFISVYGVGSDEVYALRIFLERYNHIKEWDEDYMWNDCISDKRLFQILS